MRISTNQIYNSATAGMQDNQSTLADIQEQIASGKRFTSMADDPSGASRVVGLNRELSQITSFQANITSVNQRLSLEDSTMQDLNDAMDRMRTLIQQGSNFGTLTDSDRASIGRELEEQTEYMASLMNTKDASGEYLFSGTKSDQQPFVLGDDDFYNYQGNEDTRTIQISSSLYIQSSDSGQELFQSLTQDASLAVSNGTDPALESATDAITNIEVTDQEDYAEFMQQTGDLTLTAHYQDGDTTDLTPGTVTYTLTDSAGNPVIDRHGDPVQDIILDGDGQALVELPGVDVTLGATAATLPTPEPPPVTIPPTPPSTTVDADYASATLSFAQQPDNILNTALRAAKALLEPLGEGNTQESMTKLLDDAMDDTTAAQDRLNTSLASVGARMAQAEDAENSNIDYQLLTETTLSSVQDLDYATAATDLAQRQLALTASYRSFSSIQSLSLFQYIQ